MSFQICIYPSHNIYTLFSYQTTQNFDPLTYFSSNTDYYFLRNYYKRILYLQIKLNEKIVKKGSPIRILQKEKFGELAVLEIDNSSKNLTSRCQYSNPLKKVKISSKMSTN